MRIRLLVAATALIGTGISTARAAPMPAPMSQPTHPDSALAQPASSGDKNEEALTPAQQADRAAHLAYITSMLDALAASAAPRDRALASQMDWLKHGSNDPTSAERASRGALLRGAAKSAPDDALVQWFWANANAADSGCSTSDPCPNRTNALALLQPDNGAAWMPVFDAASKAHDATAADTALGRMATATRWDGVFGESLKAWMDVYARYPVPPGQSPDEMNLAQQERNFESAMAASVAISIPAYKPLVDMCSREKQPKANAVHFRDCAAIGRLAMNHADSQIERMLGRAVLRISGNATAADLTAARDLAWMTEQRYKLFAAHADDQGWFKADIPVWLATWDEMAVTRSELQRAGIALTPPEEWQPHGRDGKPVNPLGESSVERPTH